VEVVLLEVMLVVMLLRVDYLEQVVAAVVAPTEELLALLVRVVMVVQVLL